MSARRHTPLWAFGSVFACVAFGGACSSDDTKPATQLLVTVDSDLAVGAQLTRVVVEVRNTLGARATPRHTFELTTGQAEGDRVKLPFSFGITRTGADALQLSVAGFDGDGEVVLQRVNATFEDKKTLGLSVFLGSACAGNMCGAGQTCYPRAKGDVNAGECSAIPDATTSSVKPGDDNIPSKPEPKPEPEPEPEAGSGSGGRGGAGGSRAGSGGGGAGGAAGSGGASGGGAGGGGGGAGSSGAGGTPASCGTCAPGETCVAGKCECPTTPVAYYRDSDGDGHGDSAMKRMVCSGGAPSGYVSSGDDCCDKDKRAYPGQLQGDVTPAACSETGFDFDCDGTSELGWPNISGGVCCDETLVEGWYDTVPACGESELFERCDDECLVEQLIATQRCL